MKITEHISHVFAGAGDSRWTENNRFVFEQAKAFGLAVAGSIAIGLGKKQSNRAPGDLDFVCPSFSDAQLFIAALERKLSEGSSHWRVGVNHRNEHCPPGAITHFRVTTALWMPICIMVIPVENFRFWLAPGGLRVQLFDLAATRQKETQAIDNKIRETVSNDEVDPFAFLHEEEELPEDRWSIPIPFVVAQVPEAKPYAKE